MPRARSQKGNNTMSGKILVVDDEKDIADLVEVYLKNDGYEVCTVYNAKDALKCVEQEDISLAVLDVMLPDMDGFTLLRRIRGQYLFPIIMLTAKVEDVDKIAGLTMGADDYITKPFNPLELAARVKTQLRRYTREKKINSIKHTLEKRKTDALLAEQRKNDLIVYLAHDLKTPLTSVIGYLTLLQDEPQISQEMRAHYTGIALKKAQRLEELINEFFDITRFNLTTLTLETEQINLSRMLEQIVSEFNPILEEKELRWQTDIEPGIEILGDADKLARVFDNLIRNAVNYSYASSDIHFSARAEEDRVEISVRNHGRTIPPDKLEHIFEQFYRVDASRASATGGAGLGLSIAKEIVELHGGTISAESGEESIAFFVTLPVSARKL